MLIDEGKYTVETFAEKRNLSRQAAINLISKLKKKGLVTKSGGGPQKRIYTLTKLPKKEPNGLFTLINKYSPEKINPYFEHHVYGKYDAERAIIDGILLTKKNKDARLKEGMIYLFRHVKNWKKLFGLAKKKNIAADVHELYERARKKTRCRKMPKRYMQ